MLRLIVIGTTMLGGCGGMAEQQDWAVELAAISEKCGLAAGELRWVDGSVRYLPSTGSSYDLGVCVFSELKERGVPMKQGFVANGG